VLKEGQILQSEDGHIAIKIVAKPEPVMTVTAEHTFDLLRAAYHLGNRHIAMEIAPHYLRFSPDPVLAKMLEQLGIQVKEEICPFYPESGAYGHSHAH
jgi:urease accessory protein